MRRCPKSTASCEAHATLAIADVHRTDPMKLIVDLTYWLIGAFTREMVELEVVIKHRNFANQNDMWFGFICVKA